MRKKQTTKFSPSRKSRDGDFYATNISLTSFLRYAILKLENNYTNTYTFTYDDEGRRTSKSNGSVTTYYYYSGNSLIAEASSNGEIVVYIYDSFGSPVGFSYRQSTDAKGEWEIFFYEKNVQGDIVGIYNTSGMSLVKYAYDAWGNIASTTYYNGGASTNVTKNNLLYRGYIYDSDLELYCLKTRYYDSETGRFISPDNINVTTVTPLGLTDKNLYAYCDNNPVMRVDQGGEFWNYIIGGIVGGLVGGIVAVINGEDVAGIVTGAVTGAAYGLVAASGLGIIAQAGVSAGIAASADIVSQTIDIVNSNGTIADYNIRQTVDESLLSAGTSVVGSLVGKFIDTKITGNFEKSKGLFDKYLNKTFCANLRQGAGKSSSSLIRQANNFLKESNVYLNAYRGVSSVVGSIVSMWYIVR